MTLISDVKKLLDECQRVEDSIFDAVSSNAGCAEMDSFPYTTTHVQELLNKCGKMYNKFVGSVSGTRNFKIKNKLRNMSLRLKGAIMYAKCYLKPEEHLDTQTSCIPKQCSEANNTKTMITDAKKLLDLCQSAEDAIFEDISFHASYAEMCSFQYDISRVPELQNKCRQMDAGFKDAVSDKKVSSIRNDLRRMIMRLEAAIMCGKCYLNPDKTSDT